MVELFSFKVDQFDLEAVDLQKLTKVIVGHDGKEAGAGWFLKQVIIKEAAESRRRYVFNCNRYVLFVNINDSIPWLYEVVLIS